MGNVAKAKTVLLYAGALAALWLLLEVLIGSARADTLRLYVVPVVPTVPGIEAAPSPAPFYARGPVVRRAPSPGIFGVDPAPPNGCEPAGFRVVSGPHAARGCYGGP